MRLVYPFGEIARVEGISLVPCHETFNLCKITCRRIKAAGSFRYSVDVPSKIVIESDCCVPKKTPFSG